jgi:hypothetical protein
MSKLITDQVFQGFVQQGMNMQHGALTDVVGCMRPVHGCDEELINAAQVELGRFRRETAAFWRGEVQYFEVLDRNLLARAWADWHVAQGVNDYGWIDARASKMALPDGYGLSHRASQDGVTLSVIDGRNPSYPSVVGTCRIDNAGDCWVGRIQRKAANPKAAIASILADHQAFEADRESRLARYVGAA